MRPNQRPVYVIRVRTQNLVAESLGELAELIDCAHANRDHVELLLAYYPTGRPIGLSDLEDLLSKLRRDV